MILLLHLNTVKMWNSPTQALQSKNLPLIWESLSFWIPSQEFSCFPSGFTVKHEKWALKLLPPFISIQSTFFLFVSFIFLTSILTKQTWSVWRGLEENCNCLRADFWNQKDSNQFLMTERWVPFHVLQSIRVLLRRAQITFHQRQFFRGCPSFCFPRKWIYTIYMEHLTFRLSLLQQHYSYCRYMFT